VGRESTTRLEITLIRWAESPENFARIELYARAGPVSEASHSASAPAKHPKFAPTGPRSLAVAAAFVLPFLGGISQIRGEEIFRSDAAVLAALKGSTQLEGTLSAFLSQIALALPLGNHAFRLALIGALFTGIAGVAALRLAHALFQKQGGYSRLDPWLAFGASLSVSFSLPWLSEATLSGGGCVGAAMALSLLLSALTRGLPRTLIGAALFGLVLGALFTESAWAGAAVVCTAVLSWSELTHFRGARPNRLHERPLIRAALSALVALVTCGALLLPALFSRSAESWATVSQASSSPWPLWSPLGWASSIGLLWCGGALFAALFALRDRAPLGALVLIIAADFLAPGAAEIGWTSSLEADSSRMALHLLALGVTAPLGALGLRTLGESAQALQLFAARPLAAMVAVLAIAGCLASAEDTLRSLEQTGTSGAQTWTDEALDPLPENALVLTQDGTWARRLLAAQALGARPDVLIVPLSHVADAKSVSEWLKREPALEVLLRDLSVSETPSERAITRLVDVRPVYLEPNENWDRRLLEHLGPGVPLAQFSPHALGRSDRLAAIEKLPDSIKRIEENSKTGLTQENATRLMLDNSLSRSIAVLEAIKDGPAQRALEALKPRRQGEGEAEAEEGESPSDPALAQVEKTKG